MLATSKLQSVGAVLVAGADEAQGQCAGDGTILSLRWHPLPDDDVDLGQLYVYGASFEQ